MKTIICTMGRPRSGKSTWAAQMNKIYKWPVVCPDTVRLALHGKAFDWRRECQVWAIVKTMINYFFIQGFNIVIFDATNYRKKNRKAPKKWAKEIGAQIVFKVFDTPKDVCIQRALADGQKNLVPIIIKQDSLWEPLDESEQNFDNVNCH